jgi:hypothetical protein
MAAPVVLALLAAAACAAEAVPPGSAEEAVAYLMFGIEDGADGSLDGGGAWRRIQSSPAIFMLGRDKLVIERKGDCAFGISRTESDGMFRATLDLSRISDWRAESNESVVEGDGLCLTSYGDCPARSFSFQVPRIDEGKLNWDETFLWLKANACK